MKSAMMEELPQVLERLEDTAKKVYDPQQVWLESMQFADYVTQLASHLLEGHGQECIDEIAEQLKNMSNSFKQMGENALQVLDEAEREMNEQRF
jgi:methyl-accepting chemotaxis protein